jgi:cell division protein FtsN
LPSSEPRKIKTLSVRGDQADAAAVPVAPPSPAAAAPAKPAKSAAPRGAPAAAANAPLSLSPDAAQAAAPPARVAALQPPPGAPSDAAPAGEARFLVQVSSQKTEADAQASYRALQKKFPDMLGTRNATIKRADPAGKGTVYRAMVGPFNTRDEAKRFCSSYETAGGQCYVP